MYNKQADTQLIQIADSSLADAALRSGHHLACQSGCSQCCVGIFAISTLDAERLRAGFAELAPDMADRVRQRVKSALELLQRDFPGDWKAGAINTEDPAFDDFGNDFVCPALDPEHQTCDLYTSRPMTCRTFGPPILSEDGIGVCDLCFIEATQDEIVAASVDISFLEIEQRLIAETGPEVTTVALALRGL